MRVFILGAGRVGRGLSGALGASGVDIIGLHGRRAEPGITAGPLPTRADSADVIIVTVRDAQLEGALREIRDGVTTHAVVLHASGSASPAALDELRRRGHPAGTFHPLVPIAEPMHAAERLRGAWIGIDGDPAALAVSRAIAASLGASTLEIPNGEKARYHAAAVLASNFPAVLAGIAAELMRDAGIAPADARAAVTALLRASVANLHDGTPAAVLTGPIVRGDVETIRAHMAALGDDGGVLAVYRALSAAAVRLLADDPAADRTRLAAIDEALRAP
jgi:predicted short-subunit dehydrogenase-like oxidoreductase (DUF2520 family)